MNQQYLYLLLDIGSFIVPFLFSFYPKANFSKQWKFALPGILVTGLIFLVWDEIFTRAGIWGFNDQYTTGIYLLNLPLEEVLFFICIPYACYFTYFALNFLIEKDYFTNYAKIITIVLLIGSLIMAIGFITRWYTFITFSGLAALLLYRLLTNDTASLGRFYFAFVLLLIPFFIVNGILTGTGIEEPVVWYNNDETMKLRMGTIPVEDTFYAMLMMLLSITIAEKLEVRQKRIAHLARAIQR